MNILNNRIKRLYRDYRHTIPTVNRLAIKKAKWYMDYDSPVVLMIDDLSNAWFSKEMDQLPIQAADWGGLHDQPNSAFHFLQEELLKQHPQVKTVFFTVIGPLGPFVKGHPFTFCESFDHSENSRKFLRMLQFSTHFEVAYHGFQHGFPGIKKSDFIQEWEAFSNIAEMCEQNEKGNKLYEKLIGHKARGGKYGGWKYNTIADSSIDTSGFEWWCRDWMPRDSDDRILDDYYEPQYFGKSKVVALPTTLHGRTWRSKQVENLLKTKQIISIEEHIAKYKPGCPDQEPNIFDDIQELRRLFNLLKAKNVWYAKCSEIADYFDARERTLLTDITKDGFSLYYDGSRNVPFLTLIIDSKSICSQKKPYIHIEMPNGALLSRQQYNYDNRKFLHKVTLPVFSGNYRVKSEAIMPPVLNGRIIGNAIELDQKGLCGKVILDGHQSKDSFRYYEKIPGVFDFLYKTAEGKGEIVCLNSNYSPEIMEVLKS